MSFDIAVRKQIGDCAIDVTFQTDAKLVAIVGQSGVGKTTLLNCIAGLITPDSGHIMIGGETLFDHGGKVEQPAHQRGCGYVFQDSRLFPHKTVSANLAYGQPRAERTDLTMSFDDVTELLDIKHLLDRRPVNLSGGELRRVAIGRALLSGPRFLLFDELLASLDPKRGEKILQTIERLRDELGIPIIYVSHDKGEVARLTEKVVTLD